MNDNLTSRTKIKQWIIFRIQQTRQNIFLVITWFTGRDIVPKKPSPPVKIIPSSTIQPINMADSFSKHLSNLIYTIADIDTENYKTQGYQNSRESAGSIEIFRANYDAIIGQIKVFATDDTLSGKKNVIVGNINAAFESKKSEIETNKQNALNTVKSENDIELRQINSRISEIKLQESTLESGNERIGEKGLLQINNDIAKNKLERDALEFSFVTKKFWTAGTISMIIILVVFTSLLSIFFSSAIYKVLFEENAIRNLLQSGVTPKLPTIVDANAIVKIFRDGGILYVIIASFFFLVPMLFSNLELIGSKNKWANTIGFWVGILVFDIVVAIIVTRNTDKIENLLIGREPQLKIWDVATQEEFWLIFAFGMLPLIITHFIIKSIVDNYRNSKREIVDGEKNQQIEILSKTLLDLNSKKEYLTGKINEKEDELRQKSDELNLLETTLNKKQNEIERSFSELLKNINEIYNDCITKVTTGRIFTDEILKNISNAYKSGYIRYLPELYADTEVANRVAQIEKIINNNNS